MIRLSLCMIVKNEEAVLTRVLASAIQFADEILVADTGSTDRTVEIAQQYTKHIYHYPWNDDFAAARNFICEKVSTEYWMWLRRYRSRRIDHSDFKVERNFKQIPAARCRHDEIRRRISAGRYICIYLQSRTDFANGPAFSLERTRPRSHRAARQDSLFSYSDRTPKACFCSHPF